MLSLLFSLVALANIGSDPCTQRPRPPFDSFLLLSEVSSQISDSIFGAEKRVAAIYGSDNRTLVRHSSHYPYSTIGKLSSKKGACPATLVSPCHVITARHCLTKSSLDSTLVGSKDEVKFSLGSDLKAMASKIHIKSGEQKDDDIALVRLNKSLGHESGYMVIEAKRPAELQRAKKKYRECYQAGFPNDKQGGNELFIEPDFSFHGPFADQRMNGPDLVQTRVDAWAGNSGGPFFCLDNSGRAILYATLSFVMAENGKDQVRVPSFSRAYSGAVASSSFASWAKKILEEESCPKSSR